MRRWFRVALVIVATVGLPGSLLAQVHGSAGPRATGSTRGHRPSRPSPSPTRPFGSTAVVPPLPFGNVHRPLPFRSSIFGLVMFDPYWWAADDMDVTAPPMPMPMPMPMMSSQPTPLIGGVQLDVEPRRALVYVDGFYAGIVDDFSGYYRHLEAAAGPHRIVLVAPDYEPLVIDVLISAGGTTTYHGSLNRTQD